MALKRFQDKFKGSIYINNLIYIYIIIIIYIYIYHTYIYICVLGGISVEALREIKLLRELSIDPHPNILQLIDVFEFDSYIFLGISLFISL